jgi:hypothetical protein
MSIFTPRFWVETAERAIKTAAQSAMLAFGASDAFGVDLFALAIGPIFGFAMGGALLSVLTSIASAQIGDRASASMV